MKKSILILSLGILLLAMSSVVTAQSSVPNLINFQGRLTDTSGNPVADGSHSVTFRLFDVPSGGSALWTEAATPTTSGGLFTHQLGSITPLSQTLFQNYDSLYLEITADAQTITPRVRLTSVPYTRLANNLEQKSSVNDTVTLRTSTSQLSTFGSDGQEQIRLWGASYGEILLYDSDPTNDQTVRLTANSSAGGELELRNDAGATTIDLHGGLTGTGAVSLPIDAISDFEIDDEPGVASSAVDGEVSSIIMDGTVQTLLSRSITAPTSGYVLVIGTVEVQMFHLNGTSSNGNFGVSNAAGGFPGNQDVETFLTFSASTGYYRYAVTVHGLFSVAAGTSTFYLLGQEVSGGLLVLDRQLALIFFPTAYGAVTPTLATAGPNKGDEGGQKTFGLTAQDIASEQAEAKAFNQARIETELAEIQLQRVALEERIKKLEEQISQQPGVEK